MKQKVLSLSDGYPIHYSPGTEQIIDLLRPYPELYERELAEHFIDTITYDNEISKNVTFYQMLNAVGRDCLLLFNLPYEVAKVTIDDICSYIVKLLDQEYYISFLCDTFYCRNYVTYQKNHKEHALFLYGYDLEKQVFWAQDYFDFRTRSRQKVSFEDIQASYKNGEFEPFPGEYAILNLCILYCKKVVNHTEKPVNLPAIRQKLENFLFSHPYSNSNGLYYGISFFDILVKRYQDDSENIDLKHCHFIVAHMQFMLHRIGVLQKAQSHNTPKYEMVTEWLKALLVDVRKTEMCLLKAQMTSSKLKMNYGERLIDFKCRYAEIITTILEIMK